MQKPAHMTVNTLSSFYRMRGTTARNSCFLLLSCVLFMPCNALANNNILSLDLCTDWMLARYANPAQVLALSPLAHQYPLNWIDNSLAMHDGSLENILDLKPDLVITGEYNAIILRQRLLELGIRVEILRLPKNLSQVIDYENHLLSLLGLPAGTRQMPSFNSRQDDSHKPRLLLLGANGIGTGRGTFENDIIVNAGWENYLEGNGYINLDLEKITVDPPDAVLWSTPSSVALSNLFAQHPALKKAIPQKRWLLTTPWKWRCPGPWTWELINELQASLKRVNQH